MIKSISIENFKSLQSVKLELGSLNLFVGTNASGKSNFFDALRVLQGIGYGFTVDEILNGKPKSAGSEVWEPIRGGSARAAFVGRGNGTATQQHIEFKVSLETGGRVVGYSITLAPDDGRVVFESLSDAGVEVFKTDESLATAPVVSARYKHGKRGQPLKLDFEKSRPILQQIARHPDFVAKSHLPVVEACIHSLSNFQRLDPSPAVLRDYSLAQSVRRMGERGENFAALIKTIIGNEKSRAAYVSWLRMLTPVEVEDVTTLSGAVGEPLFAIREGGVERPAPVLSDGTLRFAAIAAAFFQPDMPDVLTIEEIENGIHPSRLRLLVEMLKSRSSQDHRQIMATTHSPIVLAWLDKADYRHTFFCKRDESTGASILRPLSEIKNFTNIVAKRPIGELFAEGWLEGAL